MRELEVCGAQGSLALFKVPTEFEDRVEASSLSDLGETVLQGSSVEKCKLYSIVEKLSSSLIPSGRVKSMQVGVNKFVISRQRFSKNEG